MAQELNLIHDSGVPAYVQIEERIRLGIAQGVWKVGGYLPTEEQLCQIFAVSRGPVRQAMSRLVQEGIVKRERRKGTRVIRGVEHEGLVLITPFRALQAAGMAPYNRVLKQRVTAAPSFLRERWPDVKDVVEYERVLLSGGQTVMHGVSYLPADTFGDVARWDMERRAVTDAIAERGFIVTRIDQSMKLVSAEEEDRKLLELPEGSSCVQLELWQWSDERPVEYARFRLPIAMSRYLVTGLIPIETRLARQQPG